MLLLPGCSNADAVGVAERVRAEIGRQAQEVPVTVSAGLATIPDNAIDGDRLLSAADAALYVAKRSGRDRAAASVRDDAARAHRLMPDTGSVHLDRRLQPHPLAASGSLRSPLTSGGRTRLGGEAARSGSSQVV